MISAYASCSEFIKQSKAKEAMTQWMSREFRSAHGRWRRRWGGR